MKIKVCGLNSRENTGQIQQLDVDLVGFIFYEGSKRSVGRGNVDDSFIRSVTGAERVGVFVDELLEEVLEKAKNYRLDYIQLHGDESPAYCEELKRHGLKVIKAISISDELPVSNLMAYELTIDLFLFDTLGKNKGGNGEKFDWDILNNYNLDVPFLLAGGICPEDTSEIKKLDFDKLFGVDLNSKFEKEPGKKNIDKVKQFIEDIK